MNPEIEQKYNALKSNLLEYSSAIIAFSGGIDSSLVAFVAGQVLGDKALAVTSASASLKRADLALAKELAKEWGIQHKVIVTDELANPNYRENPANRCFYCKSSLYTYLDDLSTTEHVEVVLNGTNLDDLGDHRPGLLAADNYQVRSPLAECQFHKADIRELSHALGLRNADKPQAACLSSRFPYGTEITLDLLAQVEAAEEVLTELGFQQCRVRHHGDVARLEIAIEQLPQALQLAQELQSKIAATGYHYVALDLGGFQSGSLNKTLNTDQVQVVNLRTPDLRTPDLRTPDLRTSDLHTQD